MLKVTVCDAPVCQMMLKSEALKLRFPDDRLYTPARSTLALAVVTKTLRSERPGFFMSRATPVNGLGESGVVEVLAKPAE